MVELERLPALDGLRAVAVYLVVAFHAGVATLDGGFVGVDVFFVLSGFLITRLLIVEFAGTGRVSLLSFYARRVRRLLPAAWVALVITAAVFIFFANPLERSNALDDARAAVFYLANWHFISDGQDYFAESLDSSPYLHLWSLAVEEQFYLVWPVVSLGLLAVWRRAAVAVTVVVAALAIAGVVWARAVAADDLLRAYYGTDTRAYQLLAGAAIAFVLSHRDGRARRMVPGPITAVALAGGSVGLVLVATTTDLDAVDRGIAAAVVTAVMVGALAGRRGTEPTVPERMLGSAPMVHLGGLSYATYLWHWPIVVLLERTLVLGSEATLVIVAVASTGLARLSMDLVEGPIRGRSRTAGRRANTYAVAGALAGTVVLGLVVVPAIFEADVDQVRAADRVGFVPPPVVVTVPVTAAPEAPDDAGDTAVDPPAPTGDDEEPQPVEPPTPLAIPPPTGPVPADLGAVPIATEFGEKDGCVNDVPEEVDDCIVVRGDSGRLLLVGDSHASKLNIAFAEYAAANDLTHAAVTMNGCAWQWGLVYADALPVEAAKQACRDQRDALYGWFAADYGADVVVVVSHGYTEPAYGVVPRPDRPADDPLGALEGLELVEAATTESLDVLTGSGRDAVVMEPIPNAPFNVPGCLSGATEVQECQFVVDDWPPPDTDLYRRLADGRAAVRTVDMTDLACASFPVCPAVVDGVQVREDRDHLYGAWVLRIGPNLMARIDG